MKCSRCKKAKALKHKEMCGICEIIEDAGRTRFGVQTASLVPAHFNSGLGEYIEDYDHLKRRREELVQEGKLTRGHWE